MPAANVSILYEANDYSKVTISAGFFTSKTKLRDTVTIAEDSERTDDLDDNDIWHTNVTDSYDLYLSWHMVSKANKDDILGNGEASYDPKTKTLTLKKSFTSKD